MRIALLAPVAWRVPPRHYGPWERVVALLARGLAEAGADVTVFATRDSPGEARAAAGLAGVRFEGVCPAPYEHDPALDAAVWSALHTAHALGQASRFDLLHNHFDWRPLAYAGLVQTPIVTTVHGFSSERILPAYRAAAGTHFVSISDADRHPALDYAATVWHGIDLDAFTPRRTPRPDLAAQALGEAGAGLGEAPYLLFFGRISPDKGTADAIALARWTGRRLVLAGIVQDQAYWREAVEPHVDGDAVRYVGSVGPAARDALLGGASALVHLIGFDEPFGLSVVEAFACGTPVLATARGSMPELVRDGTDGALVSRGAAGIAEAADRLAEVEALDRAAIRAGAEARFSHARMARDYLAVYRRLVR